jgi:hypothetical protein
MNYYKLPWMTQEFLKETFTYCPTGKLIWRTDRPIDHFATLIGYRVYLSQRAGKVAGKIAINEGKERRDTRVVIISFKGEKKNYPLHRLIFMYHHGYVPELIDHINADYLDNRIENLQELNNQLNTSKAGMFSHNTSGYKGVRYRPRDEKWIVNLKVDGKGYYLGQYDDLEYAAEIYNCVAKAVFGEYVYQNKTSLPPLNINELGGVFFEKHLPKILKSIEERYGEDRKYRPD